MRKDALARGIGIAQILSKDEAPRFGLGRDVALADGRRGMLPEDCASIALASAADGDHGRALAWGRKRFGARCRICVHAKAFAMPAGDRHAA